jgi:cysteine desulfurase
MEHPSVLEVAEFLEEEGFEHTTVDADPSGLISADAIAAAIRPDTILCSVLWAHNEIGTIQPIVDIARVCRERNVLFHTDATQAVGRIPVDASDMDLLSFSSHKMYGPKGVGALLVRRRQPRVRLRPILVGGGQQGGYRSGTLPVPLIVGLGEACALANTEMEEESARILALREHLHSRLYEQLDDLLLNGHPERRLPGNLNVSFLGVEAQAILLELPGIALSAGSACHAEGGEPSPAILALGRSQEEAHASLRFGLGRGTSLEEVDQVADAVIEVVQRIRRESPVQRGSAGEVS